MMRFFWIALIAISSPCFADELSDLELLDDVGLVGSSLALPGGVYSMASAPVVYVKARNANSRMQTNEIFLASSKEAQMEKVAARLSPDLAKQIKDVSRELEVNAAAYTKKQLADMRTRLLDLQGDFYTRANGNAEYQRLAAELDALLYSPRANYVARISAKPIGAVDAGKMFRNRFFFGAGLSAAALAGINYFYEPSDAAVITSDDFTRKSSPQGSSGGEIVAPNAAPAN